MPLATQQSSGQLFANIVEQGARLPSERRYAACARSQQDCIAVPCALYREIVAQVDRRGESNL